MVYIKYIKTNHIRLLLSMHNVVHNYLHWSQYIPVRLFLQPSVQTAVSLWQTSFKQFSGLHPQTQEPFTG